MHIVLLGSHMVTLAKCTIFTTCSAKSSVAFVTPYSLILWIYSSYESHFVKEDTRKTKSKFDCVFKLKHECYYHGVLK